jgi:hypothetical protein
VESNNITITDSQVYSNKMYITLVPYSVVTLLDCVCVCRRWGEGCVENVMIERTPPAGEAPRYGRVAFRTASVAAAVLGGRRLVKLFVNGRQLWARKYVHKPQQQQQQQ